VIMLPTPTDVQEFRGRMFAKPQKIEYATKHESAEDELRARFGDAESYRTDASEMKATAGGGTGEGGESGKDVDDYMVEAAAAAQSRRANIEKLLGPLAAAAKTDDKGRPQYTIRL